MIWGIWTKSGCNWSSSIGIATFQWGGESVWFTATCVAVAAAVTTSHAVAEQVTLDPTINWECKSQRSINSGNDGWSDARSDRM